MLLTLLCYQSCNPLKHQQYNGHTYTEKDIEQQNETFILQEFPNCTCLENHELTINEHEITDDQPTCILGSFIIGANQPFTATVGFTNNIINASFHINETKDDLLGVLEHPGNDPESSDMILDFAITKIQCKRFPCKIQFLKVQPSYLITKESNNEYESFSLTLGSYSFVSTKLSGSVTLPYEFTINLIQNNKTNNVTAKYIHANALIANFNTKSFTYKIGKNSTLYYSLDGKNNRTAEEKGPLGSGSLIWCRARSRAESDFDNFSFIDELELEWKESQKVTSEDKKVMLIPEFEARLSTKGGVFTQENIDQPFHGVNNGLSPGAIAGIVIACIAVVAIIAVCIWLFAFGGIKKCKKDKSDSSSNSKKEQEEK